MGGKANILKHQSVLFSYLIHIQRMTRRCKHLFIIQIYLLLHEVIVKYNLENKTASTSESSQNFGNSILFFCIRKRGHFGMTVFLPVGVVKASMPLCCQSSDLFPVGNQLLPLHLNLRSIYRVRLLQTVSFCTKGLNLNAVTDSE